MHRETLKTQESVTLNYAARYMSQLTPFSFLSLPFIFVWLLLLFCLISNILIAIVLLAKEKDVSCINTDVLYCWRFRNECIFDLIHLLYLFIKPALLKSKLKICFHVRLKVKAELKTIKFKLALSPLKLYTCLIYTFWIIFLVYNLNCSLRSVFI